MDMKKLLNPTIEDHKRFQKEEMKLALEGALTRLEKDKDVHMILFEYQEEGAVVTAVIPQGEGPLLHTINIVHKTFLALVEQFNRGQMK